MPMTTADAYKDHLMCLKHTMSQPVESLNPHVYDKIMKTLTCMRLCESMQELNVLIRTGIFMARREEKRYLRLYLRILYGEIMAHTNETPTNALTILLTINSPMQMINEVRVLMHLNNQEENILHTSPCLFEWIRVYNFCEDLSFWITAFFQRLHMQPRQNVIEKLFFANIEKAFMLFFSPELRPRVASIFFHMLGNIQSMPQIFHKILPQVPAAVNHLKKYPTGVDKVGRDSFVHVKDLILLSYILMKRFSELDDVCDTVKLAIELLESPMSFNNAAYRTIQQEPQQQAQQLTQHGQHVNRCGLVNVGNSCYMNSVVQVLAMTKEFGRDFLLLQTKSVMLQEMQKLIALLHHSKRNGVQATSIISATHPADFLPGEQQDSSEFLGHLLNQLHNQEINEYYQQLEDQFVRLDDFITDTPPSPNHPPANSAPPMFNDAVYLAPDGFLISVTDKTFAGKASTILKCLKCGWRSRNDDSFHELQLSFPESTDSNSEYSVQSLVDTYYAPEILDGENQYQCCHCQCLRDGERCIQMVDAPRNLILTLKQFNFEKLLQIRTKLMHNVFHNEKIVMKLYSKDTLEEMSLVQYSLYAAVVHNGLTLDSGHYYTLACDHLDNWYKFDDSVVSLSHSADIHKLKSPNTPYILFYRMCGISHDLTSADPAWIMEAADQRNAGPLTIEELPLDLQNYINKDNKSYQLSMRKRKKRK